jgi:hypothetical protein
LTLARLIQVCLPVVLCLRLCGLNVSGEDLVPRSRDGSLQVSAWKLHFITGKNLERLRNGIPLPFDFQLTIAAGAKTNTLARAFERFVVSYDLWEEKFWVVRWRDRKSSQRLSATQAESWCLDNLAVPETGVPTNANLWARLEIRSAETRDQATASSGGGDGISLTTLIEIFSKPVRAQQERWALETGPFRLADLRR